MPWQRLRKICSTLLAIWVLFPFHSWSFSLPKSTTSKTSTKEKYHGKPKKIAVIGGGPSGVFAAITAAEKLQENNVTCASVTIYEASKMLLQSLKQPNQEQLTVLEDPTRQIRELLMEGYPRGRREITAIMTKKFPPTSQQKWFHERGVKFFGSRDDGDSLAADPNKFFSVLEENEYINGNDISSFSIHVKLGTKVTQIIRSSEDDQMAKYQIVSQELSESSVTKTIDEDKSDSEYDCIILATGSSFQGYHLAKSMGHTVEPQVRSMFGFLYQQSSIAEASMSKQQRQQQAQQQQLFEGLNHADDSNGQKAINTAPYCRLSFKLKIPGQKKARVFKAFGAVKFGTSICNDNISFFLTGRAPYHLSSFAAKEIRSCNYEGKLFIHFCPEIGQVEEIYDRLWTYRQNNPNEILIQKCPLEYHKVDYDDYDFELEAFSVVVADCVPTKLWEGLCQMACGGTSSSITKNTRWGNLSPKKIRSLADTIVACPFEFNGRYTENKEENSFFNAGGVKPNEIDMAKMSSKMLDRSGVFFLCGHMIDIDGSSLGYNRMMDWATGYTAGLSAAEYFLHRQ